MKAVLRQVARGWVGLVRNGLAGLRLLPTAVLGLLGVLCTPVFGLGAPLVRRALRSSRAHADRQRQWTQRALLVRISEPDHAALDARRVLRPGGVLRDPVVLREVAWWVWQVVVGVGLVALLVWSIGFTVLLVSVGVPGTMFWSWLLLPILVVLANPLCQAHARVTMWLLAPPDQRSRMRQRLDQLVRTRSDTVDAHAAELRRIERDLHDGTQARLIALGLSIGMARSALATEPARADALLDEAQETASATLTELRTLVRGIHPPVLAERGLGGAVTAIAASSGVPVRTAIDLPERYEPAVESAVYFAAAEVLSNVGKHSGARYAQLRLAHHVDRLRMVIVDDGCGGADPGAGTGLRGIEERLAAFDGTLTVHSPSGGPTEIVLELPCVPLSPRISASSGTESSASSPPTTSMSSTR